MPAKGKQSFKAFNANQSGIKGFLFYKNIDQNLHKELKELPAKAAFCFNGGESLDKGK